MEDCPPIEPSAEHRKLRESAGTWNVKCTYFTDPSQPPMKVDATETVTMFGDFFTVSEFKSMMGDMPFRGSCTVGYDTVGKQWVSTWIDTMTPHLYQFSGTYDESGTILSMTGPGANPMTGGMTTYRSKEEHIDPNHRKFEMFMELEGQEIQLLSYEYARG